MREEERRRKRRKKKRSSSSKITEKLREDSFKCRWRCLLSKQRRKDLWRVKRCGEAVGER